MKKLLIPIVMLLLGTGAGVGAGLVFGAPPPAEVKEGGDTEHTDDQDTPDEDTAHADSDDHGDSSGEPDYIKIPNQFVVPILTDGKMRAMVIVTLALEADEKERAAIQHKEPKLRDAFLKAMFDHASIGGFDGNFTENAPMQLLHGALLKRGREIAGSGLFDVLILEIARQDI